MVGPKNSITIKRLILRQWRQSDLEPFAELNADPRVREFFLGINRYMLLPLLLLSGSGSYATATSPASEKEQAESQRGYLQLKFKDLSWSLHLLRRMGYAPSGGADIGECLEIAEHIQEGDFQSWQTEWAKAANKLLSVLLQGYVEQPHRNGQRGAVQVLQLFSCFRIFLAKRTRKTSRFRKGKRLFYESIFLNAAVIATNPNRLRKHTLARIFLPCQFLWQAG